VNFLGVVIVFRNLDLVDRLKVRCAGDIIRKDLAIPSKIDFSLSFSVWIFLKKMHTLSNSCFQQQGRIGM
jgi:hypothetical protein